MKERPLAGRRVVVTRPEDRAGPLVDALRSRGAEIVVCPSIAVEEPADTAALREVVRRLPGYEWIVFTSVYAVRAVMQAGAEPRSSGAGPVAACVGEVTAAAARGSGWRVAVVPEEGRSDALAEALVNQGVGPGTRVLFPAAADALETVPTALRAAGALVDQVVAYAKVQGIAEGEAAAELRTLLEEGRVDALTFTSPSTVRGFVEAFPGVIGAAVIVIGPTTAAAARECGFNVARISAEASMEGLVRAVVEYFEE